MDDGPLLLSLTPEELAEEFQELWRNPALRAEWRRYERKNALNNIVYTWARETVDERYQGIRPKWRPSLHGYAA